MSIFRTISRTASTLVVIAVAACGGESANPGARGAGANDAMRVALLTPGPISDQSWNAGAYAGLQAVKDSLGANISHIQTKTPAEFEENFRQYGAEGYRMVVGHGFEFQDAATRIAPSYPKTVYVVTSGRVTGPNLAGVSFAFEEASYQAGVVAGHMTKSNVLGLIAGTELPPVKASFAAFEAGAKSVNPKVQVLVSYIGTWDDVSAGKEQALAQIARGADILFQNADAAGLGVFQAARERGVLAFGTNSDQNGVAPDVVIGSVVIDLPKAFLQVAREVQRGDFQGRVIDLGVQQDVVRLVLNPAAEMSARIPAAARVTVDSIGAALRAGTFRALDGMLHGPDSATAAPAAAPAPAKPGND